MIYKVLVLGNPPSLQAGFLNQVSGGGLSYQLYTALGIGIGVARLPSPVGAITLQLWLIPSRKRFAGITRRLMRGANSSIVVLREEELGALHQLLLELTPEQQESLMIVVVGSLLDRESVKRTVEDTVCSRCEIHRALSAQDALHALSEVMTSRLNDGLQRVTVMLLDERHCPEFQFRPDQATLPVNTKEEKREIREFARSLGIGVSDTACVISLHEGVAEMELATGTLLFRSRLCEECKRGCKKAERICIIGQDKGWSSQGMGPRALLAMAKLEGLNRGELPADVRVQIDRAACCPTFVPIPGSEINGSRSKVRPSNRLVGAERPTLLEEAEIRMKQGRLSSSVYNMLKSKLQRAESRSNRPEGADNRCR
ncbi:MAG: hypothetical protein C4K47_10885 [Candidatus Thorarchaeota archaeon]|nr:MAG: hypothetical protein C4K47_10885 [Candidatus Thorarchaeota archaeon]